MFESSALRDVPPGPELVAGLAAVDPGALDEVAALEYALAMDRQRSWCEARRFEALVTYAHARGDVDDNPAPGAARLVRLGGEGTPPVDEFASSELAAAGRLSEHTARAHLATALDLHHRLPGVLALLMAGVIPGWRAKLVAEATRELTVAQVALAEQRILPLLPGLGARRLTELVRQVVVDTDPDAARQQTEQAKERRHVTLDPEDDHGLITGGFCADPDDALRFFATLNRVAQWLAQLGDTDTAPIRRAKALGYLANPHQLDDLRRRAAEAQTDDDGPAADRSAVPADVPGSSPRSAGPWPEATLYVHYTRDQWHADRDGAATLEGVGAITVAQARDILRNTHVRVQPVIDLDDMPSSDDRFVRGRMRTAMVLKNPHCPFPYCTRRSRHSQGDHTVPWPLGRTALDNLSPPDVKHHRAKTHAGWQLWQPCNGILVWRSPHGRVYVVDHRGVTYDVGLPPGA
jgi:hypothetical protein